MCTALEIADRVHRFRAADRTRCAVAPHPDAEERIKAALEQAC